MASGASAQTTDDVFRAGMVVRREVLGDAHVERAVVSRVVDAGDVDPEIVVTPGIFVDRVFDLSSMSHESTEVAS